MRTAVRAILFGTFIFLGMLTFSVSEDDRCDLIFCEGKSYPLYPETMDFPPDIPSPYLTEDGTETVVVITRRGRFAVVPVTVENGDPWIIDNKRGKGLQLKVDNEDFYYLAKTGLHSEVELEDTRTITGRSVAEITQDGHPGRSSGAGFMADDEDILSVLMGDNRLASRLGMTHPELAKPLFHVFNIIRLYEEWERNLAKDLESIDHILYHGARIRLSGWRSGHGWQDSIFDDEIRGFYQIDLGRDLESFERAYLQDNYSHLSEEQISEMINRLSWLHIGEMAAFYAMRYGFYEGHTGYRADPLSLAFIFRLTSLEEIDSAADGELHRALTQHYSRDNSE